MKLPGCTSCENIWRLKDVNYFRKTFHLIRLTGFRIRLCTFQVATNVTSLQENYWCWYHTNANFWSCMDVASNLWTFLLQKWPWHRCFPMNFAKNLRTPLFLLQNIFGRLLLELQQVIVTNGCSSYMKTITDIRYQWVRNILNKIDTK